MVKLGLLVMNTKSEGELGVVIARARCALKPLPVFHAPCKHVKPSQLHYPFAIIGITKDLYTFSSFNQPSKDYADPARESSTHPSVPPETSPTVSDS
jgi:hypothetical protein